MKRTLILLAWMLATFLPVLAAEPASFFDTERQRIAAERRAAEARFVASERACQDRFAMTACVERARKEQREALTALRHQQTALDERQRQERAAERLRGIEARRQGQLNRPPAAARAASGAQQPRLIVRQPTAVRRPAPSASAPPPRSESPEEAARHRDAFAERQKEAQAHARAVEQRTAKRAAKGKPVQGLPTPPASAVLP